jgi:hypothetical protein
MLRIVFDMESAILDIYTLTALIALKHILGLQSDRDQKLSFLFVGIG